MIKIFLRLFHSFSHNCRLPPIKKKKSCPAGKNFSQKNSKARKGFYAKKDKKIIFFLAF